MKHLYVLVFVFLSVHSYSQSGYAKPIADFNTYGYVNGLRLDSLPSFYAEFHVNMDGYLVFDYGQPSKNRKTRFVTNADGKTLYFQETGISFLLNFLHYNHWDLIAQNSTGNIVKKE